MDKFDRKQIYLPKISLKKDFSDVSMKFYSSDDCNAEEVLPQIASNSMTNIQLMT